jgi:hypothetical protein
MEKKDIRKINKVWKGFFFTLAAALAVCAWIWNPGHLFTAGLILAFAFETQLYNEEDHDII